MSIITDLADRLRAAVLAGDLAPGTALAEVDIAERYGVARPTAKSAIEQLVRERLLRREAHRTARVVQFSADEVYDIYRSREVIESAAVRHLAGLRIVPPEAIEANTHIAALVDAEPREIVGPDVRFHRALVAELGSERLSAMYASVSAEVVLCMSQVQGASLLSTAAIAAEHDGILAHIAAGDGEAAASALAAHIGRARDRLMQRLR